jgi:hypothetical protein
MFGFVVPRSRMAIRPSVSNSSPVGRVKQRALA